MTDLASIKAVYCEWKMVKTRKALVLLFEVPLEHQELVQQVLGTPMPDESIWVAIAKLRPEATAKVQTLRPLSQVAGTLCSIVTFRRWLAATSEPEDAAQFAVFDIDMAAQAVRTRCGITSRRELDSNIDAARKFRDMRTDYENWMRDAA